MIFPGNAFVAIAHGSDAADADAAGSSTCLVMRAPLSMVLRAHLATLAMTAGLTLVLNPALAAPAKPMHHRHPIHTAVARPQTNPADTSPAADTSPTADTSPVVARMGRVVLHADKAQNVVANLPAADRAALARDPKILARVLAGVLADRFLLDAAQSKHWDEQPAIAAALQRLRDNAIVQSYLQSLTVPPADYPSDTEIAAAYEANKSALVGPKQFEVAQIFVAAKDSDDAAAETSARNKILAIARRLREPGSDFASIARSDSEAKASAVRGGEIGWLTEAQLRPEIKPQILALAKGGVSDPIRLADGWQILKLLDIKPAGTLSLDQVHDALKQRLRQQRASDLQRAYLADLIKSNPISVDAAALQKLVGATGEAAR